MSVRLRTATAGDVEWLRSWLMPVASAGGYGSGLEDTLAGMRGELHIIDHDAERIGVVVARQRGDGTATIELVATTPGQARRGSGMQAAALVEEGLRRRGVRRIYAPAAAAHGIAMYFWIRLGYRPLLSTEWPCATDGVAWLARDLPPRRTAGRRARR